MLSCLPAACGNAPLAQLDRASDYESEGREFESLRVHFFILLWFGLMAMMLRC